MKKIFTVLMALGIALCTMANPTFSVAERLDLSKVKAPKMEKQFTPVEKTSKAVRVDKQEARQAMVEARQAQAIAPMAINGVRQIEAMPVAEKQAFPVVNNKQRAAAQATAATDTVEIVAAFWAWEYYESDNDWFTTLVDATETYEIKLDYVSDTQAGTFTEADCLMEYTGLYIYDAEGGRTSVGFTEVDIVVTDDENGLTLHAELLSTDNVLYIVDAHIAPLPEPKATVELAYANATLVDGTRSSETFQFWGDENGVYTSILLASDQVEGEYDKFDMYVDYANYIMFVDGTDTTFVDFLDLNAVVTKEGKTYNLVADALGSDTIMYHITMSYTKPAPTDTIDIVATNLYIDEFEFWGMVFTTATASNDEYEVTFDLSIALEEGEYATEDFNASYCGIVRTSDMAEIAMTEISATVTGEGGDRVIKAEVVGSDNVLYNMDLSYVVPEATDTVLVVFDELATAEYYSSSADYYIVNQNENYIVTLDIFEEKGNLMGEYSVEDFDLYYTQLGVINGDTTVVTIADAKAVVTPVEEGIVLLEAELVGMDAVLYKVSTKVDVADKGLQHDATEGFLMDEYTTEDLYSITDYSNYGFIYFDVEAADGTDLMGLQFWVDGTDENTTIPVGTYPINDSMEPGTIMASAGLTADGLTYSLYATMDAEGKIVPPCWFMVGGEVVVSEENGILSITVDAVNSNNLPIFITCEYDLNTKQGLPYDMTEGSVERTYSDADVVKIDTQYVAQYGQLNFAITAADASDMISMVFFVEEADAEIGIPAGVYTIDDSGDYGTVYASPGVQDGSIYPSFYGVLSATGGIVPPCYFMVGGQVVVENVNGALKVTIDALNSYDVPAHIVYEATPITPAEPVEMVGVVKRAVQNGDEVIVLTHEEDGTAHIYQVVDGKAIAEVSQEGVIPVDTENPGSYLAISDIAVTEDGKLVANNYNRCSFNDGVVETGYKRGTLTFYIWDDLAAAPTVWFQSKASSNSNNSDQGYTMALTGTSTNANILVSGVHNTQRGVRMSHFSVVDGVYEDTQDGSAKLPYYYYIGSNFKGASAGADAAVFNEQTQGANLQFHASPLADEDWIIDGELTNPIEFTNPQAHGGEVVVKASLSEDLGKKYNGATYVTLGENALMVAPYADAEGKLAGVKVLDITAGLDNAVELHALNIETPAVATAAATAVAVEENALNITLVADATIYTLTAQVEIDTPDQGINLTATGLETRLESDGSYTLQGLAVVNGDESNLMDFMLCVYPTEGYTDAFLNGWSVMIFGAPTPDAFVENEDGTFTYTAKIEDTYGDGTVYNINMSGTINKSEGPEYSELDDQITNMVFDLENMVIYGGPSANFEIEVVLGLGEDNFDGSYALSSESSVSIRGIDAEFIEGYVYDIDINAPSAVAVVKVNWDGMYYAFTLYMSAAPAEATVVVVENATVEVEKYLLFGDTYDYSLKMTGNWLNEADGLTYPVVVEVPVYYPEATEPTSVLSTVTVGGMGDNDPWLGFGEGELTVTTVDDVVTATGIVSNWSGLVIDITISGTITPTSVENATVTVKPVKVIKNGQLIITKDGKEYNAQGAIVK